MFVCSVEYSDRIDSNSNKVEDKLKNEEVLFFIGNVMFIKVGMVMFLCVIKLFLYVESFYLVINFFIYLIIILILGLKYY